MLFKSFKAQKVFGYLDFDINFNDDISFLVGGNGSGKTTALRLMNALSNPNFIDLLQIPFEEVHLTIRNNKDNIIISAREIDEEKVLTISTSDSELKLPSYSNLEVEYYSHKHEKIEEMLSEFNRKYSDHEVVQEISKIKSPVFLGLERRQENSKRYRDDFYFEREMYYHQSPKSRSRAAKRLIVGSLGISLMETEMMVQNAYRRLRESEDRYSENLRDAILLSAFQYSDVDPESLEPDKVQWKEKQGLIKRKEEIMGALSKIGVKDSKLSEEVANFFNRLSSLFENFSVNEDRISLEWLLNKAQIDRMVKIVEIIDGHKSKTDKLFKPINDFLRTINKFYEDSDKKLVIDTVGQLTIQRPNNRKCTIEGLSSGERQLLVIFAHAFFNKKQGEGSAFIIDEPELSLHLKWQEKFAETISFLSPESQFILATHSPEIVGVNKNKAVGCR